MNKLSLIIWNVLFVSKNNWAHLKSFKPSSVDAFGCVWFWLCPLLVVSAFGCVRFWLFPVVNQWRLITLLLPISGGTCCRVRRRTSVTWCWICSTATTRARWSSPTLGMAGAFWCRPGTHAGCPYLSLAVPGTFLCRWVRVSAIKVLLLLFLLDCKRKIMILY